MQKKSNAVRIARTALILLASITLTGCVEPYARVTLRPFPDTATASENVEPDCPEIQEALAIIDSILTKNGYVTQSNWTSGGSTSKGWYLERSYEHNKPNVSVMVYHMASKDPATTAITGKRSVEVHVEFRESNRMYLKMDAVVIGVQTEIAQALAQRFGNEKVTTTAGRQAVTIQ